MKAESMATDTGERKPGRSNQAAAAAAPEPEHLPCPRCDSTNTKFCYYNNYNLSQPLHFCKSCRRYWAHGGTLRDIPIGGGRRKNAKRSRTAAAAAAAAAAFSSPHRLEYRNFPAAASQILVPFAADHGGAGGPFTSLLSAQGTGFWALGGFGIGLGHGPDDVGFGLGKTVWPFPGIVEGGPTWQVENGGEGGLNGGDCFAFPDLAISTPGGSFIMK